MHDIDRCTVVEVQVFLFSVIACESETILPLFLSYSFLLFLRSEVSRLACACELKTVAVKI